MICYQNLLALLLLQLLNHGNEIYAMPPEEIVIQQQVHILKDLMVKLHEIHKFDNFIIYRTPRNLYEIQLKNILLLRNLDQGQYLNNEIIYKHVADGLAEYVQSPQIQKPLMSFTISPWKYTNNSEAIPNLGNFITNKNLAIFILNDIFNSDLTEFVASSLGACLETKIVFLLVGHGLDNVFTSARLEKLKRFFDWCWSKNILNVLLLFPKNHIVQSLKEVRLEIYTYTPFPRPTKIIELTDQHPSNYFLDRTANLFGYKFRSPVVADKPLVFKYVDPLTGNKTVTGISGKIYMEYVKYINSTFNEVKSKKIRGSWIATMDYIYDLLKDRNIHISINPLTALVPSKFSNSYPISNTNSCVVVPVKQEIFPGLYIPRTLSLKMWFLLLALFLTFQIAYMFINHDNYGQMRPWLAFSTTLRGLLSMPVDNMGRLKTISMNSFSCRRKICMHMLLLLTGMICCQTHIAALSSFLSSTLYPEQIESLEDLIKANLSIMLVEYIRDTYKYLDLLPDNITQNLIIADADTVSYHLNQLDTRYAYIVYNEEWKVVQNLQRHLLKPRFKIVPKLCIPNVYLNLPIQYNSPFYHSFKKFILRSQSAGLDIKWSDMVYWQVHKTNILNNSLIDNVEYSVLFRLEHLTYIFYIYIGGMILAGMVFFIELKLRDLPRKFF